MFVTDALTPIEMLAELLGLKNRYAEQTAEFRELSHNRDLCPSYQNKVSTMLDTYMCYRADVSDRQGPRDEGVDVHLRYYDEHDQARHIGLQIKSYSEIESWRLGGDKQFIMRLKAQIAAATQALGVDTLYLLLCTDEKCHADRLRMIESELIRYDLVRIVRPQAALAFLKASDEWISAFVARTLCASDPIIIDALEEVENRGIDFAFVLASLMCMACEGKTRVDQEKLMELYEDGRKVAATLNGSSCRDRSDELLLALSGDGLNIDSGGLDRLDISAFPMSWTALWFDARYRQAGNPLGLFMSLLQLTTDT